VRAPSHRNPGDFTLLVEATLSDSYELSKVLLATADFQGTMQLLTSGWERSLGYARQELNGKTLGAFMARGSAAGAVAAILDRLTARPVHLSLRCRDGVEKSFRLHRRYDRHEDMMYLVAEESVAERRRTARAGTPRRSAPAAPSSASAHTPS
jgi:PAS domain S-box-containing protein